MELMDLDLVSSLLQQIIDLLSALMNPIADLRNALLGGLLG